MIVAVDFDGTLVEYAYPEVGRDVPGAVGWLRGAHQLGARIILLTMRDGDELEDAVRWCEERGIELWAVNDNPDPPGQSQSRKVYAHAYVDDAAVGCPLITPPNRRPFVDWSEVGPLLLGRIAVHRARH